jgi:hypothetical protein
MCLSGSSLHFRSITIWVRHDQLMDTVGRAEARVCRDHADVTRVSWVFLSLARSLDFSLGTNCTAPAITYMAPARGKKALATMMAGGNIYGFGCSPICQGQVDERVTSPIRIMSSFSLFSSDASSNCLNLSK